MPGITLPLRFRQEILATANLPRQSLIGTWPLVPQWKATRNSTRGSAPVQRHSRGFVYGGKGCRASSLAISPGQYALRIQ